MRKRQLYKGTGTCQEESLERQMEGKGKYGVIYALLSYDSEKAPFLHE